MSMGFTEALQLMILSLPRGTQRVPIETHFIQNPSFLGFELISAGPHAVNPDSKTTVLAIVIGYSTMAMLFLKCSKILGAIIPKGLVWFPNES
jgi:hypothetical protein